MSNSLSEFSQIMLAAVEQEMRSVLKAEEKLGDPFYGMMHYHMGWIDQNLKPTGQRGGKRIRPLLCLLTCEAAGGDWQQAVPGASALELLHNFTLIHDDIQDASPTRRGKSTVWRIWGENQAINSGDALFALSHIALTRMFERGVKAESVVRALRRLDETCIDLTKGQYEDMLFESQSTVTVDEYLEMIGGKTAALLAYSSELGAIVANCSQEIVDHFAAFGRDLGLAFQVRDDILGIWGDETVIGKSAATDIVTRKKSLPVLYGLTESDDLRHLYDQPEGNDNFVENVVQCLNDVGARAFAEAYEQEHAKSALFHLQAAGPQGPAADALRGLTNKLLDRQN